MLVLDSSVCVLINKAENALVRGRINIALSYVHDFVERTITEPMFTARVFASQDLDQLCLRIGRQNLACLALLQDDIWPGRKCGAVIVYLVSRFQRSGGHSRLVRDFIRAQPEKNHLILSTEIGGPSDKDHFSQLFSINENVRFECAPRGDFKARLNWLQSMLLTLQPEHVYLFNHHQDSVAVAALTPELGLNGSFIHHGDHHLCLGVYLSHLTHVDLHPMGYHHCRDELGVHNRYLPLTFEDMKCTSAQTDFSYGGPLTTATAARFNKIEIPYYVSYLDTIPAVLKVTGGKHVHIGKLTPWARHRIYRQMRKQGVQKDRFVYLEWAPSIWKALQDHKVDLYIASFPYGAGLTLIEAMGAGVPVIMHEHMYSRMLSGLEMAYPESFRWGAVDDLLTYLAELQPIQLDHEKKLARAHYEKFHRPELLKDYMRDSASLQLSVPPLRNGFKPRYSEWVASSESRLNLSRLFYRFAYRILRRLRRWVN